jgi:hypothetical protein
MIQIARKYVIVAGDADELKSWVAAVSKQVLCLYSPTGVRVRFGRCVSLVRCWLGLPPVMLAICVCGAELMARVCVDCEGNFRRRW